MKNDWGFFISNKNLQGIFFVIALLEDTFINYEKKQSLQHK